MSPNCSSPETVCLQCGDKGFTNAFVYCVKCLKFAVHRYCLNVIPKSVNEFVRWFCDDCEMEVLNHPTTCRNDAIQSKTRDRTPSKHILGTSGVAAKKFVILALDIEQRVNKGDPCRSIDACAKPESIECAQSADKSSCSGSHLEPGTVLHSITSCNGPFESSKKKKTNLSSEANFEERKQQRVYEDGNRNREQEVSEDRTSASHHESDFHRGFSKDSTNDCIVRAEPLMEPIWSGSFNIWNKKDDILEGLMAHVSSRACRKVHEEACQFQPVIHLEMLPKSNVWPKSLNTSEQSAGNIALYFFPSDTRSERVFDYLVNEMVENELALKAIVQNAELLVFTSTELPLPCWRFQGKYYLWGVFREKQHKALRSKSCNREQRYNTIMHKDGAGYTDSSEGKIPVTMKSLGARSPLNSLSNCSSYASRTS